MSGRFLAQRLRDQTYWLYLPIAVDPQKPLPLLVMLHGCGQSAAEFAHGTRMNQHAHEQPYAVLYPEQHQGANCMRCWNWFGPETQAGGADADLIAQIIEHTTARHPIDSARRYLIGFSAGAAMAAVLCTTHAHLFAGCAMHSGIMARAASNLSQALQTMRHGASVEELERSVQQLQEQHANGSGIVPRLVIQGSEDTVVHPINAQRILEQTALLAGRLPAGRPELRAEQWFETSGRRYRQQDLTVGDSLLLRHILIDGLAHAWSGGEARQEYFDSSGPDATRLILQFLLAHPSNVAG
jgi:poly(hydroxyalkanoate) depolymerase family esterase